jgi:hypothetical protein
VLQGGRVDALVPFGTPAFRVVDRAEQEGVAGAAVELNSSLTGALGMRKDIPGAYRALADPKTALRTLKTALR